VRRVDENPHYPSYDLILIMIVPVIALERYITRGLLVGAVKG
jgi:hypothetical protein